MGWGGRDGARPLPMRQDTLRSRRSATIPLCSEVLASVPAVRSASGLYQNFSPVVDALCRLSPHHCVTKGRIHRYQRSNLLHPLRDKTRRIIKNIITQCKQRDNKNEIGNMVRTNSCGHKFRP